MEVQMLLIKDIDRFLNINSSTKLYGDFQSIDYANIEKISTELELKCEKQKSMDKTAYIEASKTYAG
jgi:hypothetical protein